MTTDEHTHVWGPITGSVGHCEVAGCDIRNAYYDDYDGLKCVACGEYVGMNEDGVMVDAEQSEVCLDGECHYIELDEDYDDDQ